MSLVRGLTEVGAKAAKKTAPFYSAVDEALANLKRPKGTGMEFLTEVMKQPGVKKAEIADRKLEEAFKAKGKMTKEEAQQVLKENPPANLGEKVLKESDLEYYDDIVDRLSHERYGTNFNNLAGYEMRDVSREADRIFETQEAVKYNDYKTPGGKNYREILLKLPETKPNPANYRDPAKYDADMKAYNASGKADYQSSHWKEDPNVLAHMRVQDRTGPNGEKILHVEEIQSDWHQAGRKKGYNTPEIEAKRNELRELSWPYMERNQPIPPELREQIDALPPIMGGVPDAPFKKNWHELAMKRLLNYAADNGYDSIAITPGAEQAKRYDLSKQINTISWNKQSNGLYGIEADAVNGRPIVKKNLTEQELEDTVGKEVANRIVNGVGQFANDPLFDSGKLTRGRLENLDLQVGGEGMKGFYDKILPDYLNTFGKPYGAQIGTFDIANPKPNKGISDLAELLRQRGLTDEQYANLPQQERIQLLNEVKQANANQVVPLHNFPITPEMREQIKQKGLPLYQQVGIPTAGAGAASQTTQEEPEYGVGGSVAKMAALAKLQKLKEEMAPRAAVVKDLMAKDSNQYLRDVTPDVLTNDYIEQEIARMKAKAEASKPEVKLADGGAINFNTAPDMSDGGRIIEGAPFKRGGKVNMTANRDTMFMELSNKKLKRK